MKIAHIALGGCLRAPPIPYGQTADTGGHIAYVLSAAMAQADLPGVDDVRVVTRRFHDPALGLVHAEATERVAPGVVIERVPTTNRSYFEKEQLAGELPSFIDRYLDKLSRAGRCPDVIHAHFADAAAVAIAARDRFGIRFVYTPHALGLDKSARCGTDAGMSGRIAAERRAIAEADAIVVSSRNEADEQIGRYDVPGSEQRVHVVAPGAPLHGDGPSLMPPLAFADPGRPLILAIARPMRKKNLVAVAEAYAGSTLRDMANLAILAGQHDAPLGAEERDVLAALRAIVESSAMLGRAALPRRHGPADVQALYRLAARSGGVFVNPALHEPFGLTLLEAAAAGLPVVATLHGGASEIVRRIGHGLLVEPHDRSAIAGACLRVLGDREGHARLAAAALANGGLFSWPAYARRSREIYLSLASRGAAAA